MYASLTPKKPTSIATKIKSYISPPSLTPSVPETTGEDRDRQNADEHIRHKSHSPASDLDEQRERDSVLALAQVRSEAGYDRARRALVSAGRRHAAGTGEIRGVRRAMVAFQAPGHPVVGHVVDRDRHIPRLERI